MNKTAYTAEQTVELVAAYKADSTPETVEKFAVKFGKTVKSVVAKLSREGVYVKRVDAEAKPRGAKKAEMLIALELMVGAELPSFKEATMKDIQKLMDFIKREGQ